MTNEIQIKLQILSKNKKALFGLSCVERIMHFYKDFEKEILNETDEYFLPFKNGHNILTGLINKAYNYIKELSNLDKTELLLCKDQCLALTPDTEAISSNNTVFAQNSSIGLSYIFDYLLNPDSRFIYYCSDKVFETIDLLVFSSGLNKNMESEINSKEVQLQLKYMALIEHQPISASLIKEIRKYNNHNQVKLFK